MDGDETFERFDKLLAGSAAELDDLAHRNERTAPRTRIDADPERLEQGLAQLVLTLVDLLRQLLERQAIRRMESGSLHDEEIERLGMAFMKMEERMQDLLEVFGLEQGDLDIDLGPLGRLIGNDDRSR